jgi:hypothetical protein
LWRGTHTERESSKPKGNFKIVVVGGCMKFGFGSGVACVVENSKRVVSKVLLGVLLTTSLACTATPVFAQDDENQENISVADRELESFAKKALRVAKGRAGKKASSELSFHKNARTDYAGLWAGRYVLVTANCTGFSPSFLFRHQVQLIGNQVAMATSHDGTLYGMSRKGGRRLETGVQYTRPNGVFVQAVVVYDNNSGMSAATGLAVRVTGRNGSCTAGYGATSIRQFGMF